MQVLTKKLTNFWTLLVLLLITLPAIYKLIRSGFYPMYDDMQVIRLEQMEKCIKDGQIPCRWVPDLGYGYGYPLFEYYSPLPYYLMEIPRLLGFSFVGSVKIGFMASVFFSALFFYLLSRKFFPKLASFLATFVYVIVPFRAASIFVRGAMGEAWGMAALPLFLWAFESLLEKRDTKRTVLFSLATLAFLTSHNLTVLASLPLIAVWIFLRIRSQAGKEKVSTVKKLLTGLFLGVGLSAFYLIPLVLERNLVHLDTLTHGYFNYVNHFLSIKEIFFSIKWGYGPSVVGADDAFLGIGPVHLLLGSLGITTYLIWGKERKKNFVFFTSLFLLVFLYGFLMHEKSSFIWRVLPSMSYFQFPWRFGFGGVFILSFLSGLIITHVPKMKAGVSLLVVILLFSYFGFFAPKSWNDITDAEKLSGVERQKQITASIYDYLPISAQKAPDSAAPDHLTAEMGEVKTLSSQRGSSWYIYSIEVVSEMAVIAFPAYDFPYWAVTANGNPVPFVRSSSLGLPMFSLAKGQYEIKAVLKKSTPRKIADLISVLSIAALIIILGKKYIKKEKHA